MGRTLWHRQCFDTCGVLQLVLSGSSSPCRQSNTPPCCHTPQSPSPHIPPPWPAFSCGPWLCFTPPLALQCTPPHDGVLWAWNCRHTWPAPSPHARTLSCLQTEILLKAFIHKCKAYFKGPSLTHLISPSQRHCTRVHCLAFLFVHLRALLPPVTHSSASDCTALLAAPLKVRPCVLCAPRIILSVWINPKPSSVLQRDVNTAVSWR